VKTSLWIVIVIVAFFIGILIGFSLAPPAAQAPARQAAPATDKAN
jgi:uncharacterized protein YneF (UPF0154 family)